MIIWVEKIKSRLIIRPLIWMLMFCLFLMYMWLLTEADVLFEALHNTRRRSGRHASETHMKLTGIPPSRETDRLALYRHARLIRVTWKYQTPIRYSVHTLPIVRKMVRDLVIVHNVTELVRWPITTRVRKICEAACVAIVGEALMERRPPAAGRSCIAARSAQPHSRAHDLGIELGNGPSRRGAAARSTGGGKRGALLMHRQLHRPSPAILPSSTAQLYILRSPFSLLILAPRWAAIQTFAHSLLFTFWERH